MIKNGINIALIGKPNAGKSSILNGLLEENKAIVTNIPGTTRDVIEGKVILDGIVLNFIDTAGIRETDDVVEKIGVQKSLESAENADLRIYVLDNSEKLTGTKIWEFRTLYGNMTYRLFAFWDTRKEMLVVVTHGIVKKVQKTPHKEIAKAETIMKSYFNER